MTGVPSQVPGWTRRRWYWLLALGVGLHALFVFWLGERTRASVADAPGPALLRWVLSPEQERLLAQAAPLSDPSLFALPRRENYSGGAWLRQPLSALPSNHWTEPSDWLAVETNELGSAFIRFMSTNAAALAFTQESFAPQPLDSALLPVEPPLTQTVIRVEGPLAARAFLSKPLPPIPFYPDVLSNTIVQVTVNADGLTDSAILISGCRLKSLDQQAVEVARTAVYRPLPPAPSGSAEPTWGRLVFQWYSLPPQATNALPALSP